MMVPVSTERLLPTQIRTPSLGGDLTDEDAEDEEVAGVWANDVIQLPTLLELEIRVRKGSDQLGLSVDSVGRGVNGMLVLAVAPGGALYRDGRIVPGDFLVAVNNENLRNVTNSQARAILRRAQLLSTDISVTYIPGEAAAAYKRSLINAPPVTPPPPKALQKSPRSPYISQDEKGERTRTVSGSESIPEDSVKTEAQDQLPPSEEERLSPPTEAEPPEAPSLPPAKPEDDLPPREEALHLPLRPPEPPQPPALPKDLPVSLAQKIGRPFELSSAESLTDELLAAFPSKCDLVSGGSPIIEQLSVLNKTELPSVGTSPVERSPVHALCVREFPSVGTSPSPVPRAEVIPPRRGSATSETGSLTLAPPESHDSAVCQRGRGSVRRLSSRSESSDRRPTSVSPAVSPAVSPVPRVCISPAAMTVVKPDSTTDTAVLLAQHWGPERLIKIYREPDSSLGISIVGGKVDLYNTGPDSKSAISGIFIKNVLPQSPAGRTSELRTGDRILEVDGVDLRTASHERAVQVIRAAGDPVSFLVQSFVQWTGPSHVDSDDPSPCTGAGRTGVGSIRRSSGATTPTTPTTAPAPAPAPIPSLRGSLHSPATAPSTATKHQENHVNEASGGQVRRPSATLAPPSATAVKPSLTKSKTEPDSSDEDSEDDEDTRDLEGRVYTKKGIEISRASAGNMRRSKEEIEADPEEEDDFGYTTSEYYKRP